MYLGNNKVFYVLVRKITRVLLSHRQLAYTPVSQARVADLPRRLFPEITQKHPEPYDVWLDFEGLVWGWFVQDAL